VLGLSKRQNNGAISVLLHESRDGGRSFEQVGQAPQGVDFPLTVDSAPSQPLRVYLSGVTRDDVGQVLSSDDGGVSWNAPLDVLGTSSAKAPYIAAIDPNRADLLYVRSDGRAQVDGETWADDALYVGDLTGERACEHEPGFCELFSLRAKLLGFALSPDGETVLLGVGDPQASNLRVDQSLLGLYAMPTADLLSLPAGSMFPPPGMQRVFSSAVSCVTWTLDGIYACTSQTDAGFALGFAESLEALGREGRTDGAADLLVRLETELHRVQAAAADLIGSGSPA